MNDATLTECAAVPVTADLQAAPVEQVPTLASPAVPVRVAAGGTLAHRSGETQPRGMTIMRQQAVLVLQRGAGNSAVASMLEPAIASDHGAPSPPPRSLAARTMSRRLLQRDAGAKQLISDAIKNNKPTEPGGADPGYEEAFRILNGLAMFDMLNTLTALQRAGQFDDLSNHFKSAIGVHVARLHVAFDAVRGRGSVQADGFFRSHSAIMNALGVEENRHIIRYLEPDWFDELKAGEDAEALIATIRAMDAYTKLDPESKTLADEIIAEAKKVPTKVVYYMEKLKELFETKEKTAAEIGTESSAETAAAVKEEQKRIARPAAAKNRNKEEKAARARDAKNWKTIPGKFGGGLYQVDNSDPNDIVVRACIFLQPEAKAVKDAALIKKLEDAIEKAASNTGYTVDLTFVKAPVAGCFTVDVHPGAWTVATEWGGGDPTTFAHELHHLLTYELDKYDYIEAHATNESMKISDRLIWFRKEMGKPAGWNDPTSVIDTGANHPNDEDVCRVAGLDLATCVAARQRKRAGKP